ncbi:glutathione S-transferase alpha-5 [Aplysia californica]|uniref:Glutathione S-transferase alpha-5 n=1 Tax=Aplysia californica TaxID=6500 RepID=A0ABM1A1Q3_APLCA|nr:glutathione S-transferase alpha-5 [Aplysia californica]
MSAKLYYFYHRGAAELSRLTCAAAGIEYTEVNPESRSDFLKWIEEGKLLFKQIPMLEIDGRQIVQTRAIIRYVARKGALLGKNADEETTVDMLFEGGRDFTYPGLVFGFQPEAEVLDNLKSKIMPKYMPIFEKVASENGTGYLVGDSLTIADLSVLEGLLTLTEYFGKEIFDGFPALEKFFNTVTSLEKISAYLNSPRRKKKNDEHCIAKVKEILALD